MLQRCYSGENCKWLHPVPQERKRLWDYWTEKQRLDEERGIPPPTKPPKRSDRGGLPRPTPSPPPPPPPPPNSPKTAHPQGHTLGERNPGSPYGPHKVPPPPPDLPRRHEGHDIDESRDPRRRAFTPSHGEPAWARSTNWRERSPEIERDNSPSCAPKPSHRGFVPAKTVPVERNLDANWGRTSDASMLDAPPSPKDDHGDGNQRISIANAEPLGRRNRLHQAEHETHVLGTGKGSQPRRTRWDAKTTKYKHEEATESPFSSDVPSPAAITLWKRGESEAADDAHMTDIKDSPRHGGYWERMRERRGFGAGGRKKDDNAPEEKKAVSRDQPTKSWDKPNFTQLQLQTSDSTFTSSSPSTTTSTLEMGATKRLSNGETKHVGPHPSTIRVSAPYMSQAAISKKLQQLTSQGQLDIQERSIAEAREDSIRLQGVGWIDNVRRSLQLPIRTYTTACVYFHKFRLAHAGTLNDMQYNNAWADACAASLLTSCKVEDTLKKSRDILAAAYNLKASTHDQLGADDPVFEGPSRVVIGLERMVLEAGGFDFRSKYPHRLLVKLAKSMPEGADGEREKVTKTSWTVLTDLYRTFAPLKQTSVTMALASLELAAHLVASSSPNNISAVRDALQQVDLKAWSSSREEIMETLLDLLDLYTQHTTQTILGPKYSLDDFLRIRLAFNKECNESNIPRYTIAPPSDRTANGSTLRVANGHPTPVSPMEPCPQAPAPNQNANGNQAATEGGGTLRFMLDPQLAADEKAQVQKYFVEEWEEYEEEVEVPQPLQQSGEREQERDRDRERPAGDRPRDPPPRADRSDRDGARGREDRERDRERDRVRDREREAERERARVRDADRDRRYADHRYEDRDRRYDDRRDRRYEDRRYEDERRRREDRR